MAPRHRVRTFSRSVRRPTIWGRSPADTAVTSLAAATAVLDSTAVGVAEGETIVRVRGQIIVGSDQIAATERWVGAVGMCIASDQAVAAGVASISTPYTDQDSEVWLMHRYFGGAVRFHTAAGFDAQAMTSFEFDSKGMRKLPQGRTLCVVVENGAATTGIEYFLQYAVLFKVN